MGQGGLQSVCVCLKGSLVSVGSALGNFAAAAVAEIETTAVELAHSKQSWADTP